MNAHTASAVIVVAVLTTALGFMAMVFVTMDRKSERAGEQRLEATVGPCVESYHRDRDAVRCHPLANIRDDGFSVRCVCP